MHRIAALVILVMFVAATSASARTSRQAPRESWGKAGVSFEQYRRDALECGRSGITSMSPTLTLPKHWYARHESWTPRP